MHSCTDTCPTILPSKTKGQAIENDFTKLAKPPDTVVAFKFYRMNFILTTAPHYRHLESSRVGENAGQSGSNIDNIRGGCQTIFTGLSKLQCVTWETIHRTFPQIT